MHQISEWIRNRRAIFPATFTSEAVADEQIKELLENANHAPTHRLTEPWRFRVLKGESKARLGELLAEAYKAETAPDVFSEMKYQKTKNNTLKASHILAIGVHFDEQGRVPEWEELAAVAMAVQNIWLSATTMGLGGYWSSPARADAADIRAFLQWNERERCLGFFYLGKHETPYATAKRGNIEDKTLWLF